MKNNDISKLFIFPFLISFLGVFASCSSSPEVTTRYMTVSDFNAAQEISGTILVDMGYPTNVFLKSIN